MDNNGDIGINYDNIKITIEKMELLLFKMNFILNKADDLMISTNSFMTEDIGSIIRKKYLSMQIKFPIIKQNLNSYIDDFKKNLVNYQKQDEKTKIIFEMNSDSLEVK